MTDYRLDVYNASDVLQAVLTDFQSLAAVRRVNAPGVLQFTLRGDHSILSSLADKWRVELWRKPDGEDWAREMVTLYRQASWYYGDNGSTFVALCEGLISLLSWRIVAWYSGVASRSKFTGAKGETIAKTLVTYNATSSGSTAAGRLRLGTISGISVAADAAGGNTIDFFCAFENLLKAQQALAKISGGDFDLVKTAAGAYEFRWYTGQLGTDRTATVKFALELGNMAQPEYHELHMEEATAAIVGGQGEGSARATAVRTGTGYNVNTNNIEMFVNATDVDTTSGLNARGDQKLAENQAQYQFRFKVLQVPAVRYGVQYFLGDKVTAVNPFNGTSYTQKVDAVTMGFAADGTETIEVELVTP